MVGVEPIGDGSWGKRGAGGVKVLIVDFDSVQTAGLSAIVEHRRWQVVGEIERPEDVAQVVRKVVPDVVIVGSIEDPHQPGRERLDSAKATREVKASCPSAKVVVLTEWERPAHVLEAMAAGVDAYLRISDLDAARLIGFIDQVRTQGVAVFDAKLLKHAAEDSVEISLAKPRFEALVRKAGLTLREAEVLAQLTEGGTNEDIALAIGIQPETAKKYVRRVMVKLGARSRTQAAVIVAKAGLLQASAGPVRL